MLADTIVGGSAGQIVYWPTLRSKSGEATALSKLTVVDKKKTIPILIVMPSAGATFLARMTQTWASHAAAIDGSHEMRSAGTSIAFNNAFHTLGAAGVNVCPVIDVDDNGPYRNVVHGCIGKYAPGLVIRTEFDTISKAIPYITSLQLTPDDCNLIIDCGHVADIKPSLISQLVIAQLQSASSLEKWRSIALTSSSAPKDASSLSLGVNLIDRNDWLLWRAVHAAYPNINFGDYGIAHRDLTEPPGYAMANATVSVRYTLSNQWLILKGRSTRGASGQPMAQQYHQHAQALTARAQFGGVSNCWGDTEIRRIAALTGVGPSGSRETWVGLSLNRHLAIVCHMLP